MIELRDYQQDLLERVQEALAPRGARVMMQLPTGGGKTIVAAHLLADYLIGGRKAVWLTHRTELARQTREMLKEATGIRAIYLERPPQEPIPSLADGVVILMAQTAGRRARNFDVWSKYDSDDLMIIDEAHHSAADGYERAMSRWRERVLGMTATPWRLSEKEGFNHLFNGLICGPQVTDLQEINFLCHSRVLMPPPDELIRGGKVGSIGDYTESGIERANEDHSDVMTAGTLKFWQEHTFDRQTIVYAVSKEHARNLVRIFKEANIPAEIMLGDTPLDERAATIEDFQNGNLQVLVNVAVATEGFDLPDASCVIVTRPTESIALYLQMVGRGLRPKLSGEDCLILDLAGNSIRHGLPEEHREWSLTPRGVPSDGDAPVVWCENCGTTSPAANHNCQHCGAPFGTDCQRCGKWRAWKRWSLKARCRYTHDKVCDLCHKDAHLQAHLPITDEMERLSKEHDRDSEAVIDHNELDERLSLLIRELLKSEQDRILAQSKTEQDKLREDIAREDMILRDADVLSTHFEAYLETIPQNQRPKNFPQKADMFTKWRGDLRKALAASRNQLAELETQTICFDRSEIQDNARKRLLRILNREVQHVFSKPDGKSEDQSQVAPTGASDEPQLRHEQFRSGLLSRDTYTGPILSVLKRMGGEGRGSDVIRQVGVILTDQFMPGDFKLGSGGRVKWQNELEWQFRKLQNDGYLDPYTPRDTWRLTLEGQELAKRYEQGLTGC